MESEFIRHVAITAADAFALTGTYYLPVADTANGDAVLIASATGVKRAYYHKFARFLAEQGYRVLVFDYRGVGGSRPRSLRSFDARMHQWGTLDIPAAQAWLEDEAAPRRLLFVGHSVAGQVLSLAPGNSRFARVFLVASQLGDFRLWPLRMRIGGILLWHLIFPLAVLAAGQLPGWVFGGEPLPAGIAWEWRKWILSKDYLMAHIPEARAGFARIESPSLFMAFSDDVKLGPIKAVRALRAVYANSPSEERYLTPADVGMREIGHFGFFRSHFADTLWRDAAAWLAQK